MRRRHGKRARLGGLLMAALGALAILALPSAAAAKDRNHDHIPDRWEKRHDLALSVGQGSRDQDRDHLSNRGEFKAGDNPRDRDSDNDGVIDGDENAGTIASYDTETGKLTISLFGGETISGLVTEDTRIRCGHNMAPEEEMAASASRHGENESGDDSGGDNSGPGNGEEGSDDPANHDENDDHGEEGNDDPPDHDAGDDNDHQGHGGDNGNRGPGHDNGFNCSPAALVVGATVDEAELELRNGKATFEKIELEQSSSTSTP